MTTNNIALEQIRARIEAMKSAKKDVTVKNIDLEELKKDIHVAPSTSQIKTYVKLCSDKHIQMNLAYRTFDGRKNGTMDKAIQALIKLPTVKAPSEAQITILKEICARNDWEVPAYATLTGGREGTFSALIGELIEMEREVQKIAPPTENQIETIIEMYHCPDVDFSDLNEQYALVYINQDASNQIKGGKLLWTRPSQESVKDTIAELVTYQEASAFIYKFQLEFYKWKTTRLTTGQMNRIKKAQTQCGMMPMEDAALLQFDKPTADEYLKRMNLVRRDADLVKFPKEAFQEDISRCNTLAKGVEAYSNAKDEMIHVLYSMMGMCSKEENETSIDLSDNDDIIADLALVAISVCGSDSVIEVLSSVYTNEEMVIMLARMYPEENDIVDQMQGLSLEELEQLCKEMTA